LELFEFGESGKGMAASRKDFSEIAQASLIRVFDGGVLRTDGWDALCRGLLAWMASWN
jgi:hypothetical protein